MVTRVGSTVGPIDYSFAFNNDPDTTTGLTWGHEQGQVLDGGVLTTIVASTLSLADASVNIVYIDYSGTPALMVTTTAAKPTQTDSVFLYAIQTSGGHITSTTDLRNWTTSKINI